LHNSSLTLRDILRWAIIGFILIGAILTLFNFL